MARSAVAVTRIQAVQRGRATRARLLQARVATIHRCAAARRIQRCYFTVKAQRDARQAQHKARGSGFQFEQPATSAEQPVEKLCSSCRRELKRFDTPNDDWWCSTCRRKLATGTSMLGCRTCDLDYCADCEPVTPEMPTEQPTTPETPTEQPKLTKPEMPTEQPTTSEMPMEQLMTPEWPTEQPMKPERPTEQQLACTHLYGLRSENRHPHCCVCGAKARLGCAYLASSTCFNCVSAHKLKSGHLRPRCRACGGRARLGCRICDLDFCLKCMPSTERARRDRCHLGHTPADAIGPLHS